MMLRLSRKTLLALEAVIDIAFNARPEPVQAKEITARQGVPQRYLEQVMQQLVRAGILKGVRGPRGGYRLARERRRISVGDVVRVAESIEDVEEEKIRPRSELGLRIVAPLIQTLQDDMMARLDAISIEDLCQRARAQGVDATDGRRRRFRNLTGAAMQTGKPGRGRIYNSITETIGDTPLVRLHRHGRRTPASRRISCSSWNSSIPSSSVKDRIGVAHDRGAGETGRHHARQIHPDRADQRQYRHRTGLCRRRQRLSPDPGDAGIHVAWSGARCC